MKKLFGIVILSLILSNSVQAKNVELENTVPVGSTKKHLCKVQGAVDKILKPDAWGDLWCHGIREKHYVYFTNYKTEIITIGNNKGVHFVYENVTKRMKCTNLICKKGNGTLRSIAYSKQDAMIIANNNKYAEFLKQKENQRTAEKPKKQDLGNKKQVLEGIDKLSINYDYHFFAHSTSGEQFWGSTINRSQFLQLGYAKSTKGYECSLKSFQANSQAPYKGTWNLKCPNFEAEGSWTQESLSSNGIGKGFSDNGNVVSAYFSKNRQSIWGIANKFFDGQGSDIKIVEKPKKEKPKPKLEDEKIVPAGSGSGFFVLKDGTIITNYHVIEGCEVNKVSYKGTQYNAKVLSVDKVNDIAILKTDIVPQRVFSVSDDDVSLLEDVVVAGYPLGKQISAAIKTHKGVVTALAGAGDNYSFFQTDAAINQGNSGGPIINQKGNVVGIAVATWVEEGVQGVHFGIKSSTLKTFASANGLSFISPNNRDFSNKELGKLITEGTVYVECHMTLAKIKKMIAEMENKKAFFSEHKK